MLYYADECGEITSPLVEPGVYERENETINFRKWTFVYVHVKVQYKQKSHPPTSVCYGYCSYVHLVKPAVPYLGFGIDSTLHNYILELVCVCSLAVLSGCSNCKFTSKSERIITLSKIADFNLEKITKFRET